MKKKLMGTLAVLTIMAMSITAYASSSQTVVASGENGETSITITDITPREEGKYETERNYTVGSYYPIEIKTEEENGIRLLVKTFVVPQDTNPQALIEKGLTRHGIEYQVSDILCSTLPENTERKTVSQTVTAKSDTDKTEELLDILSPTFEYTENGFSGTLTLDVNSVRTKVSDTAGYSYTLKETKEYTGLDRNDPYYIPKTAEKNGVTLNLSDVVWTPIASSADNDEVPTLFKATALYKGTAFGNKATEYLVTATYTGEVVKINESDVIYSIVYEEIPQNGLFSGFDFAPILVGIAVVILVAGAAFAVFWFVRQYMNRSNKEAKNADIYENRPAMDLPEILNEMDRGLEDDKR